MEFDFYPKFYKSLDYWGCDEIYQHVFINGHYETDLVGVKHFKTRPPKLIIIEVKEIQLAKLVAQAYMRLLFAHRVYAALAWKKDYSNFDYSLYEYGLHFKEMRDAGIGFIIYDELRDSRHYIFGAKEQEYRLSFKKTFEALAKTTPVWTRKADDKAFEQKFGVSLDEPLVKPSQQPSDQNPSLTHGLTS